MDELEISGKRYISTRRAAKEYKYHSDYIGQLIRGKKLVGRKVGRSWYVELESLAEYFGKEGKIAPAPLVARAPAPEPPVFMQEEKKVVVEEEVLAPVVAQKIIEEEIVEVQNEVLDEAEKEIEQPVAIEIKKERDSIHIPVRVRRPSFEVAEPKRNTLTYITDEDDNAEFVPLAYPSKSRVSLATTTIMPRSAEELEEVTQENNISNEYDDREVAGEEDFSDMLPLRKNKIAVVSVAALGALVLVVVFGSSMLLDSHTVIEAGKGATAGYSLH